MHNFDIVENHSKVGGGSTQDPTYILDSNGNKIQRYEDVFFIPTEQFNGRSTDEESLVAAVVAAAEPYVLSQSDCSDVVTEVLKVGEDDRGVELIHGDDGTRLGLDELPRIKQQVIEIMNKGGDIDDELIPSAEAKKVKSNEKSIKEKE